ncbi:hypothetical protein [Actinomyces faecalis]|uniref:hypothetical protein n=1 Tax=Actinomyces faecalis TaxID=2722820 RepID=UPI0015557BA0|nr:hypothetical protein [Actinomyces faecalis]
MMREFTKTVTTTDGHKTVLTRTTDQPGEARTLLATGWEETTQEPQDTQAAAPETAPASAKPERKLAKTAKTEN